MTAEIKEGYDRVTDVLYPFSGLNRIDQEILAKACLRGKLVHQACDAHIKDIGDYIAPEYQGYVDAFKLWAEDKVFLETPPRFYDDELMLTGECDLLYMNAEGKLVLADLKTSYSKSQSWLLQGSAYSFLLKKLGYKIEVIEFVHLKKTGKYPTIYQYEENFPLYKSCLDTYRYFYKDYKPDVELDYL